MAKLEPSKSCKELSPPGAGTKADVEMELGEKTDFSDTRTTFIAATVPYQVESKKENLCRSQCKLFSFHIRVKQPTVFKLEFKKSPSYKDDSNESCNLNLKIHLSVAIIAIHPVLIYINITFYVKPGFFLFLDNLEQTYFIIHNS